MDRSRFSASAVIVLTTSIFACSDATTGHLPNLSDEPDGTTPSTGGGASSSGSIGGSEADDGGSEGDAEAVAPVGPPMTGLHVVGNHIENADGLTVVLHGVNRSGTEYECVQGHGVFDGPSNEASVQAMVSWRVNAVRVPLNEDCWLGINEVAPIFAGDSYKKAIVDYVMLLHQYHIVPILDLHWTASGGSLADRLQPLADADHAPAFWTDVAETFKDDDGVVLEPFNEPFPDRNRDTDAAWQCWRDGCVTDQSVSPDAGAMTYEAAGMQSLVDSIRNTGAKNLILLGGVQFSNALTQWLTYKPRDPLDNVGAAWHVYNNNGCGDATCWDDAPARVAAAYPIVATEIGENDCAGTFITPLMQWLDQHGAGYLAWSWDAYGACRPITATDHRGNPWPLVADYSGTVNGAAGSYAQTYHDHIVQLAQTADGNLAPKPDGGFIDAGDADAATPPSQ